METKVCESCGMPMQKAEDFGGGNLTNKYCVHCTDNQGNLQSWDEKVKGTTQFMMIKMKMSEEKAREMAIEMLKKNPAWKDVN